MTSSRRYSDGTGSSARTGIILEVQPARPELDQWLPDPAIRVFHRRQSTATAQQLWDAAQALRLADTRVLGRLIRWRIPGVPASASFAELFGNPPFTVLARTEESLVAGLVGKIWTLRRDYPTVDPDGFCEWTTSGTAKVMFANWVAPGDSGAAVLHSETRVKAYGPQGRVGLASLRPLVRAFEQLIGNDALAAAVRRAERPR